MGARFFEAARGAFFAFPPEVSMSDRRGRKLARIARAAMAGAIVSAALGLPFASPAQAQLHNAPIDLQIFRPAMDSKGFITLNSSGVLALGDFSFGLVTTWASKPLTLTAPTPAGNRFQVGDLVTPSLQAAVGIAKLSQIGVELGIVVPMAIL